MTIIRALAVALACVVAGGHGLTQQALAQGAGDTASYPNRIVRLIVPFPPGGNGTISRTVRLG